MRRLIAWTEIVGGLLGIGVGTVAAGQRGAAFGVLLPLMLGAFVSVLAAGVLLLRQQPQGYTFSCVVQAVQVLLVATPKLVLRFQAGPQLLLGVRGGFPVTYLGFNADATLLFAATPAEPPGLVLNLVPLVLLVVLLRLWRRQPRVAAPGEYQDPVDDRAPLTDRLARVRAAVERSEAPPE